MIVNIPANLWISANDRIHWREKAKRTASLRLLGKAGAQQAGLRDLGPTFVAAHIGYPRGGKADPSNAFPTVKALIDGITDAGAWPDDDHTNVIGPHFLRDKSSGQLGVHTVRFTFTSQEVPF